MTIIVNELDIEDIELLPMESLDKDCTGVIPHAPIDPIAIAADQGGYKPDCSFMELQQAIRVLNQYHDLQRERQKKIIARMKLIAKGML